MSTYIHHDSDIIQNQPTINIGMIGHANHGKTTLVKVLTGTNTQKFSKEVKSNKTIFLGYANAKIWLCKSCDIYSSSSSKTTEKVCRKCNNDIQLLLHVSFVDCPGHHELIGTMLQGGCIFDNSILLISSHKNCPQPQTIEHIAALKLMMDPQGNKKKIIIVQNKLDIISKRDAITNYSQIYIFKEKSSVLAGSPIIPVSAINNLGVDNICRYIHNYFTLPQRNLNLPPCLPIIRSFNINKPGRGKGGSIIQKHGGIIGGSLINGIIRVDDIVEIYPGKIYVDESGEAISYQPYRTRIVSIKSEQNNLTTAYPGGLIGIETTLDAMLCKSNGLVGGVMGVPSDKTNKMFKRILITYHLMSKLCGVIKCDRLKNEEQLRINIGATFVHGIILAISGKQQKCRIKFINPPCACGQINQRITFSRKIGDVWTLIGRGQIKKGNRVPLAN